MKLVKTPLRYPGGKSRAVKQLYNWFPSDVHEYREPFIGGASMALYFSQLHPDIPVWVNDKYTYLYNFWVQLQERGNELSDACYKVKTDHPDDDTARDLFDKTKKDIEHAEPFDQAVLFWVLNKCSYSGLTENSSFSPAASRQNFTLRGAAKLKNYPDIIKNWRITNEDYEVVMSDTGGDNVFCFLDPPYKIKSFLYGTKADLHKNFDHPTFKDICSNCVHKWLLTYNVDPEIEEAFSYYNQRYFRLTYGMQHRANNVKDELLISNYEINPVNPLEKVLYA